MDLKDLKELLRVLRDKGVTEYECQGVRLKLSEEAPLSKYKRRQEFAEIEGEPELTEEERLFYSAIPPMQVIEEQQQ